MRNLLVLVIGVFSLFAFGVVSANDRASPLHNVGRVATHAELRKLDISVFPNGVGLPDGKGTASEGKAIYQQQCAACHGDNGEGRPEFPALVGGRGTLASVSPLLTVGSYWPYATSIFDYIRRAMPYATPGSLTDDQVYAVTAWLLYANDIISATTELNQRSLPDIAMPNRDGFVRDPQPPSKTKR